MGFRGVFFPFFSRRRLAGDVAGIMASGYFESLSHKHDINITATFQRGGHQPGCGGEDRPQKRCISCSDEQRCVHFPGSGGKAEPCH